MDAGLYITFFNKDESRDRELPPVGPLDQVVLRHRQLVAERRSAQQAQDPNVSIDRWLEAELELQRATGEEPGGTKRVEMRVTAGDGVFLRFAVFGDAREREPMPEIGPFAVVVVGPRGVEGDGRMLATRAASDLAPWDLTSGAGDDFAGLRKPDIAFRSATGGYHGSIAPVPATRTAQVEPAFAPAPPTQPLFDAPAPPSAEPTITPPPREDPLFVPPREELVRAPTTEPLFKPREEHVYADAPPGRARRTEEVSALTASDLELIERIDRERAEETLRARVQEEERRRLGVDEAPDDAATTWAMRYRPQDATAQGATVEVQGGGLSFGALLWRVRVAIIGVLLVGVGAYGFTAIRTGTAPSVGGVQQLTYVGVGTKLNGTRWDWVVNGVQRSGDAGTSKAQGVYYVVRVGATNKGTDGAQVAPNDFVLIDANGIEHGALGLGSGPYQSPSNPGSANIWPREFPVGKTVNFNIVFDIDPSLGRGMALAIADVPKTRVRLD